MNRGREGEREVETYTRYDTIHTCVYMERTPCVRESQNYKLVKSHHSKMNEWRMAIVIALVCEFSRSICASLFRLPNLHEISTVFRFFLAIASSPAYKCPVPTIFLFDTLCVYFGLTFKNSQAFEKNYCQYS